MTKRTLILAIFAALTLAGCAQHTEAPQTVMPQPIASDLPTDSSAAAPQRSASDAPQLSASDTAASSVLPSSTAANPAEAVPVSDLLEQLYRIKAEQEALDVEEDIWEASLRTGAITREQLHQKEQELENSEDALELSEDQIDLSLRQQGFSKRQLVPEDYLASLEGADVQALRQMLKDLEIEEDQNELNEELLARQYSNGEITREDYLASQIGFEREDYLQSAKGSVLELKLKELGWWDD